MSSYIAFDLDALNVAGDLGRAAGITEDRVVMGLARMWAWCFRSKTEFVSPTHVKGFFGADAVEALAMFGFLSATENNDLFRVRGADRYLRISEGRSRGGKAAAAAGNLKQGVEKVLERLLEVQPQLPPSLTPAEPQHCPQLLPSLSPNTEHRTPNTKKIRTYVGDEFPPVAQELLAPPSVDAPTKPVAEWSADDFWLWAQHRRQQSGLLVEKRLHPAKLSGWWSIARQRASTERLKAGFNAFGADKFWESQKPPFPFSGFITQWDRFAPPEVPNAART